jgi:hypothetical protein
MSFGIYLIGLVILLAGLIYGATLLHMPSHWIVMGALIVVGFGILSAVRATRQKDPS